MNFKPQNATLGYIVNVWSFAPNIYVVQHVEEVLSAYLYVLVLDITKLCSSHKLILCVLSCAFSDESHISYQ